MLPQRLRDRNHDSLCGLSRPEADLVLTEIQVVPRQRRDISQPLSGIQSKQDQTPPFWVCGREYALNFCDRKRTPLVVGAFANSVDKLARVFGDVAIPLRLAKQRLDHPQVMVCGRCRGLLRHLIPEFYERRPRNRGEVEIRCGSEELE